MPRDITKTLDSILKIIDKDIKAIKRLNPEPTSETALILSRHTQTLLAVEEANERAKQKQKKAMDLKSIDELIDLYQKEKKS